MQPFGMHNSAKADSMVLPLRMLPLHARFFVLGLTALLTALLFLVAGGGLHLVEEQLGGMAWTFNPDTTQEQRINVIAIDEKSLEQLGPWPWPRETLARLSNALTAAGAQLQVYDIVLPEPREGDEQLAVALQNSRSVIAQFFTMDSGLSAQTGQLSHPATGLTCNPAAASATGYIASAPVYSGVAKGHITSRLDSDGAIRSVPSYLCFDNQAFPSLTLAAFLQATGVESWSVDSVLPNAFFGPERVLRPTGFEEFSIPVDRNGNMRVSFRKSPESFRVFSAVDVINSELPPDVFDNVWTLIGYTAFGLDDIVPTPFNGAAPGVEIQARLLTSVLDGNVPYTPRSAVLLQFMLGVCFAGALLVWLGYRDRSAGLGLLVLAVLLPLTAFYIHSRLLVDYNIWMGWIGPALFGILASSLLLLHEYTRVRIEKGRLFTNLSSYLPSPVAREVAFSLPDSGINARRENVTLLCADLRNFSAYGESRLPEESAALLHYFFARATAIVEANGGEVYEFKGDSLIALWQGADANNTARALKAALVMQETIQNALPQTPPAGLEPLVLGIGIENGPVLLGSIGPAHRRTHTMLGETVTVALRIQEMTADLAHPILLGSSAARELDYQGLESQGQYLLAGLRNPHTLFAPHPATSTDAAKSSPVFKIHQGGRH